MEVSARVKANRCFLEGKHAESIRYYDEALTAQANDVVCVCNRACAFFMMDLFRRCIKDCNMALALDPSCLRAYLLKGRALASLKKFTQAKATWEQGLQQEHGDVELLLELRLLAQTDSAALAGAGSGATAAVASTGSSSALDPRIKTHDAAIASAIAATSTNVTRTQAPDTATSNTNNSLVLSKRSGAAGGSGGSSSSTSKSIEQYAQATAEVAARGLVQHGVGRAHIDERIALGYLQVNTGNFAQGIELFNTLLEAEPNLIAGYLGRGTAYALQGSLASAIRDFSQAITIDPNCVDAWKRRGQARAAKGFDNDAIFDLTKASLLQPDHEVFHQRGLVYYKQKNYRRGMEDFKRATEFDENNHLTWNHYGLCLNALGESGQAATCYQRATQLLPNFKEAWTNMAQAYKELGQAREAELFFSKAAKVDPTYMHTYHLRALYLFGSGQHSEAITDLKRGLQLSPTSIECRYMLAIALHGLGLLKEALNEYAQCVKMKQDHVAWYNREIAVYLSRQIDIPWRSYNMDRELDAYFKEAWCKRLHPSTLARYKRQTPPSKWQDVTQTPTTAVSAQMMQVIKAADFVGRALQNRSPGYLPNRRQYRMCGLAVLETAQNLRRLWTEGVTVPANTSSGNQAAHAFGWRDMFDICVRWRQLSEPNDPVWWVDLLSPEQFEEGFGSHTPMITGQTRVVRYYPMFARAFPLMRQLINEQCNLSESSKDTISRATSCKDLYDVMRRDFWVVTACESTNNPGTAHEGTRITLQYSAPEGYEFSIRTPGTPSRWAEYDKELDFVWKLLYDEATKPERDIERLSELILTLAFYWYNFMPLSRGTAACGYVAILALFLSFDIWIESAQQPTQQVDWEAILTPSPQAFIATLSPWMYPARCMTTLLADLPLVEQVTPTVRLAIEALNAVNDNPPPFPVNATDPVDVSLAVYFDSIKATDRVRAPLTDSIPAAAAPATVPASSSSNTASVPDDVDSITTSNTTSVSDTNAASDYSSAEDGEVAMFDDGINSLE